MWERTAAQARNKISRSSSRLFRLRHRPAEDVLVKRRCVRLGLDRLDRDRRLPIGGQALVHELREPDLRLLKIRKRKRGLPGGPHRGGGLAKGLLGVHCVGARSVASEKAVERKSSLIARRQEFRLPVGAQKQLARGSDDGSVVILIGVDGLWFDPG